MSIHSQEDVPQHTPGPLALLFLAKTVSAVSGKYNDITSKAYSLPVLHI
jgi:hypothetical protein